MSRSGLLAGGNFIVDHVKVVDHYPAQDTLANILRESSSNGGGPYNVLKDNARLGAPFPLEAIGLVGEDANGRWIFQDCRAHGIGTAGLQAAADAPTSYTDVMSVEQGGRRTFFHQRGANARLAPGHFDFSRTRARWFHLGYLGLLDTLDAFGPDGRTGASHVLEAARRAGLLTSVDMVSAPQPRFRDLALSSGPFADVLFVNEIEAGYVLGADLRQAAPAVLAESAAELRRLCGCGEVVLHCESGAVTAAADTVTRHGSLRLPGGFSRGAAGAGDAFAAGYLHGLHEDWPVERRLLAAVCVAAQSLTDPTCSNGIGPLADALALAGRFGARAF